MTRARYAAIALALGGLAAWGAAIPAQEGGTTLPATQNAEEVARQRFTKRQFEQLTAKMIELADLLEKAEPQTAKALREAVAQAQRAFIAEDMEKVADYLAKGLAAAAAATESEVIEELRKVLQTLQYGLLDLEERMDRLRQWKEFLDRIEKILGKQRELERQSAMTDRGAELGKQADALASRLADIIARQKELMTRTGKLPEGDAGLRRLAGLRDEIRKAIDRQTSLQGSARTAPVDKLPVTAQLQKQLGESTADLAGRIGEAGKDPTVSGDPSGGRAAAVASAAKSASQAAAEMAKAADALGKSDPGKAADPQSQAIADLKDAAKALDKAIAGMTGESQAGNLAKEQGQLADKTSDLAQAADKFARESGKDPGPTSRSGTTGQPGSAPSATPRSGSPSSGNLNKASEHMRNAAENLASHSRSGALDEQRKALDELEARRYQLAELKRRVDEAAKTPTQQQASEQGELAGRTDKLSDQMKRDGQTPGQQSTASAAKSMGSAAGKLSQGQTGSANADQSKAIEDLQKARDELAEAVQREEEMAQAEQLGRIDQMLQKILDGQKAISAATKEVYGRRRNAQPPYDRPEQLKLTELANGEGGLAADVKRIRDMLIKEGTTEVFPTVLKEVQDDLRTTQELLAKSQAGELTQRVQKEIEESLEAMVDAIRKELADRRNKNRSGGGGGGGGGGRGPLVPPVAELKMLRSLQLAINRRTVALNEQAGGRQPADPETIAEHKKLSERQETVEKMTKQLKAKLMRAARPGADGGL